jgi:hypothetical protein
LWADTERSRILFAESAAVVAIHATLYAQP